MARALFPHRRQFGCSFFAPAFPFLLNYNRYFEPFAILLEQPGLSGFTYNTKGSPKLLCLQYCVRQLLRFSGEHINAPEPVSAALDPLSEISDATPSTDCASENIHV